MFELKNKGLFIFNNDDVLIRNFVIKNKDTDVQFIPVTKDKPSLEELLKKNVKISGHAVLGKEMHVKYQGIDYSIDSGFS